MATLHIFNPDTDYALASGRRYYTPPAHVVSLRRQLALLPAIWARPGDAVLLLDKPETANAGHDQHKDIRIVADAGELQQLDDFGNLKIAPWGWNLSLRQFLKDSGVSERQLPTEERLSTLRELSHRRTTIEFLKALPAEAHSGITLPEEIFSADQAVEHYRDNPRRYFKAPWSSSGRGILLTDDLEERHVEPWVRGIIRRQGSVMMEPAYDRVLDFATEWACCPEGCRFLGYSVFTASRRGKYHSNLTGTQEQLRQHIAEVIGRNPEYLVEAQRKALAKVISPGYEGPVGIDMLADRDGRVNPCVELNLRHTMGMVEILKQNQCTI